MSNQIILPSRYDVVRDTTPARLELEMTPSVVAVQMGLKRYAKIGQKGDLHVFLSEVKVNQFARLQPCLVLANARNPRERHVKIPLSHLWQMLEPNALASAAPEIAAHVYGFVTSDDCFRVLDAIIEYAEDLKNAKPPRWMSKSEWLAALAVDGFTILHQGKKVNG